MSISKWVFAPRAVALALIVVVFGAAGALAQTSAYVTNLGDNTVSVIDTGTSNVTATVPVGAAPIPVAATGASVYVTNSSNNSVDIIDTATNTVTGSVPVGVQPFFIAFSPPSLPPSSPTSKDQCKNGGWQTFTNPSFQSQGQCIKYVNGL